MPPKKKQAAPSDDAPLKAGEMISFSDKSGAVHEAKTLADEDADGNVQAVLLKSRGQAPTWKYVFQIETSKVTRA